MIADGISARNEPRNDSQKGLGDFQQRLNRDKFGGRRDHFRRPEASPRHESSRSERNNWEATPRDPTGSDGNWGGVRNRKWDAPTPRASRGGSPTAYDESTFDAREWEEEQTKLDRDWYTASEDGTLVWFLF